MKNPIFKSHPISRRLFPTFIVLLGAVFLTLALAPAQASAQDSKKLADYLSYQEQLVVGLNFKELRKSKYYPVVMNFAKSDAGLNEMIGLLDDAGVDFSTDISALTLGVPDTNIQQSLQSRQYSVAISGAFDSQKLLSALKSQSIALKSSKIGKKTLYSADNIDFAFPKEGVIFVTSGPKAYRGRALSALKGADKSVTRSGYFKRLVGSVKTSKGVWGIANAAADENLNFNEVGMSLDVSSGLLAEFLVEMADKDAAAQTVELTKAQAKDFAASPMVAMLGAKPLVTNLKMVQEGTRVKSSTQLSPAELDGLIQRAGSMIQSKLKEGTGIKPSAPAKAAAAAESPQGAPDKPIKADFN